MKTRIGYFIPEFPGQTHIFYWREREALKELGIAADWVSTRRPPRAMISHTWANDAEKETAYLVPISFLEAMAALGEILRAGPVAWIRCLKAVISAHDTSLPQKLRLLALIGAAGKLARLWRTRQWSHIHIHSCADAANVVMFASLLSGLSYSLTLHGPTLEVYGPNQPQKWQHASFGLVVSEKLLHDIKTKLADYLPERVFSVPMGVNLTEIKRQRPYSPWSPGQVCRIFACGRLNPIKGHNYLLETIALLRQRGVDVQLQIAGEDEQGGSGYRQTLEQLLRDQGLEQSVTLLGAVSQEGVRRGLESAHLFALASLNEGIPVAVMEAMAMELPVVVTDVGGNAELIDDRVDGILVQPERPAEMADAIEMILRDPEFALRLSQASRQKIAAKFHERRSAEILAKCIEDVLLSQ
ncbi:MAG: glycosyltransferase family 4 protein [Synechococcales cyanobacterium M58_A2018_015]|nr:glycosyltransferase family 4 protein [Synechococcales cyanobacterium M58_A2018_015]